MESVVEKLQRIGLTEYESRAYLALLNTHLSTATKVAEQSGVPRTKIYMVLESLASKGWIRIYSGVPLLFKAADPRSIFERMKEDYAQFLESVKMTLGEEVKNMKDKFVVKRFDIGLENLKEEMKKAKTIEINNATADFIKKVSGAFREDAMVKVLLFPQQPKPNVKNVQFKHAEIGIVSVVRQREVPSMSILLDESRTFTAFQDPVDHRYIIDEMLYDECSKCFFEWSSISWGAAEQEA
ncbi:TrmB family transcriptional regulator [Candidatus Bathyarchaeota archaeon]|nr:TrmB family transcriptional regulator [Candidatus Bathyarchaeota archaeon]